MIFKQLRESSTSGFNCTLFIGHLGSYKKYNKKVEATVDFVVNNLVSVHKKDTVEHEIDREGG